MFQKLYALNTEFVIGITFTSKLREHNLPFNIVFGIMWIMIDPSLYNKNIKYKFSLIVLVNPKDVHIAS